MGSGSGFNDIAPRFPSFRRFTVHPILVFLTTTPAPTPSLRPGISQDDITPGTLGFIMTAFFVLATTLLLVDMVRRVRRVRYRGQVEEERLAAASAADAAAQEAADSGAGIDAASTGPTGTPDDGNGTSGPEEPGTR